MNHSQVLRVRVAVPLLPGPVDNSASLTLEDIAGPGILSQAYYGAFFGGGGLRNHRALPSVFLTSPAGVDLVLELSRVNALLPSWTDGVLPLVLHLQGTTGLAGLALGCTGKIFIRETPVRGFS